MLYFAYGSNLSTARLKARISRVQKVAVADLPGFLLRFHKVGQDGSAKCDAAHTGNPEHCVRGAIYEIGNTDRRRLDLVEGPGYEGRMVTLWTADGKRLQALTYLATVIDPHLRPYHWYRWHVLVGAREHGLPLDYLRHIEQVPSMEDPEPGRTARELSIYNDSAFR